MNFLFRFCLLILIAFVTTDACQAQYSGLDLLGDKKKKEIPFKYVHGFIVVKLYYANLFELNFLFDTGASHNILFKKQINDILNIEYSDTIMIGGADIDVKMKALVSRNIPMELENTNTIQRDIIVLEKDFLELEMILGTRIDGIIGGDFFKGLVVGINHNKKRITIHHPSYFEPKIDFSEHDIEIKNYKPYIKSKTTIEGKPDTLNYLIDSGASIALLVHSNKDKEFEMPENVIIGNLGKGLGGDITGYVGMIDGIKIDQYNLNNVITSFQEIDSTVIDAEFVYRDGIIGNVILSRFHYIIDYMREKLYLKEISKLDEEFDYDKSGILIYALGENLNEYYIKTIYPSTPAQKAGLKSGDKIIKLGCWPIRFYSMESILKKLKGKEGKKIKMTVLRNGKKVKVEFRLRDFFNINENKKGDSALAKSP